MKYFDAVDGKLGDGKKSDLVKRALLNDKTDVMTVICQRNRIEGTLVYSSGLVRSRRANQKKRNIKKKKRKKMRKEGTECASPEPR